MSGFALSEGIGKERSAAKIPLQRDRSDERAIERITISTVWRNAYARLVPVIHPDTDTIRRAHTVPSVTSAHRRDDGALVLVLRRFGRTADREVADAIVAAGPARVVLDLRGNGGGDFDRMRRVASLFVGAREGVIRLLGRDGPTDVALPAPLRTIGEFEIDVLIGPGTASSAEVLAALLRRHAGARLIGAPTLGKDWLTRLVPVDHDWRLAIPAERIEVLGETLARGLTPDIETAPDEQHAHE